ncbi:MAG TPA: hypothetical protein VG146_16150 [Verrucomicrobiae bacterium]|nr:hypothetical protein [Verrucomicrobiae bacterium]
MKTCILISSLALVASSLMAAEPKDDVTNAAKKLADQDNYSWKQTMENANGGGFGPASAEGKIEKGGAVWMSMTMRDNTIEAVKTGNKGAIKTEDGWVSMADAAGGDRGPAMFMARRLQNFKGPATQVQDLLANTTDLKQDGDVYSGDLNEEGAKSQLRFGGRGGNGPEISGAKGTAKFWVKDGLLSKYAVHVKGTVSFNGNDRDVDRTTTVEIKNVGSTKVEVPEEAKKKMG